MVPAAAAHPRARHSACPAPPAAPDARPPPMKRFLVPRGGGTGGGSSEGGGHGGGAGGLGERRRGGAPAAKRARSSLVACPVCGAQVPSAAINIHLDAGCTPDAPRRTGCGREHKAERAPAAESAGACPPTAGAHLAAATVAAPAPARALAPAAAPALKAAAPRGASAATVAPRSAFDVLCREPAARVLGRAEPHGTLAGHHIIRNFLSEDEEAALLRALDDGARRPRWVLRHVGNGPSFAMAWGVRVGLTERLVRPPEFAMPSFLDVCMARFGEASPALLGTFSPVEANALDYRRAQGHYLGAHFDDRHLNGDVLCTLSLAGDCVMTFQRCQGRGGPSAPGRVRVPLPRRSLSIQTGQCRYDYTHAIANEDLLSERRVSITFRELGKNVKWAPPRG